MVENSVLLFFVTLWLGAVLTITGYGCYLVGEKRLVNRWIGFRTYSTRSNLNVWEAINKASGIASMRLGIAVMAISVVFRILEIRYFLPLILIAVGVTIIEVIKHAYEASEMARREIRTQYS